MSESTATTSPHPRRLPALFGGLLERALDAALALDPETRQRLAPLQHRALRVEFRGTPLALGIRVEDGRLRVGPADSAPGTLGVSTAPGRLPGLLLAMVRGSGLPPGAVELSGDAELARRLERIASGFAPDFDDAFARVFGDVAGFQIARALRQALRWSREAARDFVRDGADYLTGESRDLIARPELDAFLDEVDAVRAAGDRLAARVQRLAAPRRNAEA
jgi:ubiquinone biosynthesis protein UbiJ